jgi:hypothetical protein
VRPFRITSFREKISAEKVSPSHDPGGAFPHGKPDNFPPSADSGRDTARFPMRGIVLSITEILPLVKSFSAKGRFLPPKGRKMLKSCGTAAQKTVPYDKFP